MKRLYSIILSVSMLALLHIPEFILGQPDPGNNGGGGPLGGGAPIGGGLGILLALGIGYGLKRLWETHKRGLNE